MSDSLSGNPDFMAQGFSDPPSNPISLLKLWLKDAESFGVSEPYGCVLSTVDSEHSSSSRVILVKEVNSEGVIFGTSSNSVKGKDMKSNNHVAGNFWWRETVQQINFSGIVTVLSKDRSDKLFQLRTRKAQAVAALSNQSATMEDEADLKLRVEKLANSNVCIQRPKHWHAYQIKIASIEFWQGSQDRFHKRLKYLFSENRWHHQRLQP